METAETKIAPVKLPLHEVLLANGYEIDREKSTARNPVLKSNGGHKVIISLMPNGDYLYFNPNDERDRGNIYTLAKNHGLNINEMIETYLQMPLEKKFNIKAKNEKENIKEIIDKFNALPCYDSKIHPYLKNRNIDSTIIDNYTKNIKVDKHFNVYFPQYSLVENRKNIFISGYTMKLATPIYKDKNGKEFEKPIKSITKGEKGLEILMPNDNSNIKKVILAESSIDTLSFAQIANANNVILIATSGNTNIENTIKTIEFIHNKLNIEEYHLAFDNDEAGTKLKESYKQTLIDKFYPNYNNLFHKPIISHKPYTKDFNDDLKLFKILKIKISNDIENYHNEPSHYADIRTIESKQTLTKKIYEATEELMDDFRYTRYGQKSKNDPNLLKKIRQLDKLLPNGIDSKLKAYFNERIAVKDKRIKDFKNITHKDYLCYLHHNHH